MEKKIRIFVDMDRTLCNYDKAMQERIASTCYPQSKENFWLDLEPMEGAIEAYKQLEAKHDVWVLTRPSFHNLLCYSEKAQWVRENLGFEAQKKLILCADKSLVKGDILIDDHNKDGQPQFDGVWIQIGNEQYPTWREVLEKVNKIEENFKQ